MYRSSRTFIVGNTALTGTAKTCSGLVLVYNGINMKWLGQPGGSTGEAVLALSGHCPHSSGGEGHRHE
jgi:hypothetical protein